MQDAEERNHDSTALLIFQSRKETPEDIMQIDSRYTRRIPMTGVT